MPRLPVTGSLPPTRRAAFAPLAALLGLTLCGGGARGGECDVCLRPAPLPPSVGFAPTCPAAPACGPPVCGPVCKPGCRPHGRVLPHPPRPFPCYEGPRRLSGVPAYRPFGLPMLSEMGAAMGRGLGALADDILLGPEVGPDCWTSPACRVGPPPCTAPRLSFRPLCDANPCGPVCGPGPVCPPPLAPPCPLRRRPACAAPACAAPVCAAPVYPPAPCATELVPRKTTKYARQQCVMWKEVECVAYRERCEEYVEPVTRTECRTVDRGCYKMVWCPKLVTEEYCKTDYVRRVRVRKEPYTYTKQVAERCERLVPYCATTYVPRPVRPVCPPTCAAPPDCAAPFAPLAPPMPSFDGGAFDGETFDGGAFESGDPYGEILGGESYSELPGPGYPGGMTETGVPAVEYATPGSPPAPLSTPSFGAPSYPAPSYGPPTAPAPSLRPIPEDSFSNGPQPPDWNPVPAASRDIPRRAAAIGWAEEPAKARQF